MSQASLLCAVQARLASQRFPRKCFAPLRGEPLLVHVLRRCLMMKSCAKVVLLVPEGDEPEFSAFLREFRLPVGLFGGSGGDVLGRYEAGARFFGWQGPLMRVTGDNPLVGVFLADRLVEAFSGEGVIHYLGNPLGTGVEIFGRADLSRAAAEAIDPYEREHCTPYFYRNRARFRVEEPPCPVPSPPLKVTVDTPENLAQTERLLRLAPHWGIENFTLPPGFTGL